MLWWTALSFGLLGSFHCVGMCGPIAFALPLDRKNKVRKVLGIITYNLGRITTYATIGALVGLLGTASNLMGIQQYVSIAAGTIILMSVLVPLFLHKHFNLFSKVNFQSLLSGRLKNLFKKRGLLPLFFIGLFNGLLPCGLVYLAIAGSLLSSTVIEGATYMILFGIGTFPLMAAVSLTGHNINIKLRQKIRSYLPFIIAFFGLLFIIRGLNLGIPYLSPKASVEQNQIEACH